MEGLTETLQQNTQAMDALIAENQALQRELKKAKRELRSAVAQVERYRISAQGKEKMSMMISAEKARRELYLNNLLRVMPEIVLFMNADLDVVMCSESYLAAANMTSYDEIIGTPGIPDRLDYPEGQSTETVRDALFQTMWNKELLEEEIYFTFVSGTPEKYYKKYTLPICNANDEPVGVILLFIDLTDIIVARENAQKASRAKSDFLANMSHEIRTPMNAVIGMTDIAQSTNDVERKDYCLNKIRGASIHLLGVINDILDMSKIEANKMTVAPEEFDFEKMLVRVTNVIGYSVDEKGLSLKVDIDDGVPQYLVSDDQRLSQVITNLLSNAVKFTPRGGTVTLKIDKKQEENEVCTLRVEVQDTGIGINNEQKARLFHSFEQADVSTSRKYGGTGLGLAISKRIVELLDGEIWVESEEGQGSRFIFTFKAKRGKQDDAPQALSSAQWHRLRVLVVDDSPDVLEYFTSLAGKYQFHCATALSGYEAQDIIAKASESYDIAFIDVNMPGMDGLELAGNIKKDDKLKMVVVMISAMEWSDIQERAQQVGVDHFISKPLFPSAILDVVSQSFGNAYQGKSSGESQNRDFNGRRILLAEDIEINREILITLLEPTGIDIECAENGARAVQMFSEAPQRYEMILMDVHMPEMDGYEATKAIRKLPVATAAQIPIVAMTANVFREDIERCLAAGMNDHIGKPLNLQEVEQKLEQYLVTNKR